MNNVIINPKFVYFMGIFAGDGSYYRDGRSCRFEIVDGTSVKSELKYSIKYLNNIKTILENIFSKKLPKLRKRENKYVIQFRSKKLGEIFQKDLGINPGPKALTFKIPKIYLNNNLEKFFWLGIMDSDGMVARKNRKISLGMINENVINEFKKFLKRNGIRFSYHEYFGINNILRQVNISSYYFKEFIKTIGFFHPRKQLWILEHLKKPDFYIKNEFIDMVPFLLSNNIIDYSKIFRSDRIFIVDGKSILEKYKIGYNGRKNLKFNILFNKLKSMGFSNDKIMKEISSYRWKMSKGSTVSVRLPLIYNKNIQEMSKFVRLRNGGISISNQLVSVYNKNPKNVVSYFQNLFDIDPKYTCKNEPLFSSSLIKELFSKLIKRSPNYNIPLPDWYGELN